MTDIDYIYSLGNGKFAKGRAGERAAWVVRNITAGRPGYPQYRGVQARKPIIPLDAPKITRRGAGRALLRAFGLEAW